MTHLVINVGDQRTACGKRDPKVNRPAVPYVLARYAPHYATTSPVQYCPECWSVAFGGSPPNQPLRLFD